MPSQLATLENKAPGIYGLNTEQSGGELPPEWAAEATNAVVSESGKLAARKGTVLYDATQSLGGITNIHEYIDSSGASTLVYYDGGLDRFRGFTGGTTVLGFGPSTGTPSATTTWYFANFNKKLVAFQVDKTPYILDDTNSQMREITLAPKGSYVLAAFGRVWTIFDNKVWYSQVLNAESTYEVGIDLSTVWGATGDVAVALAEFNGNLVIFGTRTISIFNNPWVPDSSSDWLDTDQMALVETISNIGCIAVKSLVNTGSDVLFLSSSGVRSLGRTIQEKSNPIGDLSSNVRVDLLSNIGRGDVVVAAYYAKEDLYILANFTEAYAFSLSKITPTGAPVVTYWDVGFKALAATINNRLTVVQQEATGFEYHKLGVYTGYLDLARAGVAATGSSYTFTHATDWLSLHQSDIGDRLKITKKVGAGFFSATEQAVTLKLQFDYDADRVFSATVTGQAVAPAEYGVAEYGIGEYAAGLVVGNRKAAQGKLNGTIFKLTTSTTIDAAPFRLESILTQVKVGRIT